MMRMIATRNVSDHFAKWNTLVVRKVNTRTPEDLRDRYARGPQNSFFMDALPPGEYEVLHLQASIPDAFGNLIETADFPKGFRFRVQAGRLTDLGTFYFVRPYAPVKTGLYKLVRAAEGDLARRASFMLPPDQAEALLAAPLGWTSTAAGSEPENLTSRIKHMSMFMAGRQRTADGGMLFGEMFGQIARRDRNGTWTWEETGFADTISAAVEAADGQLFAIAEHSTLLRRDGPGQWRTIQVPIAGALPCFISAEPDGSLFTIWENRNAIVVLSYRHGNESPWEERFRIPIEPLSKYSVVSLQRCMVLASDPLVMVIDQTPSRSGMKFRFHFLNKASRTWTRYQGPEMQGGFGLFRDGTLYAAMGWKPGQDFKISHDLGKTWEKRGELSWSEIPVFRDLNEGYLLRVDNAPQIYASLLVHSLWRTTDGGRTWARQARLPKFTATMMLLDDQELLFVTAEGKLHVSHDNGASLTLERDSSDPVW